MPGSRGGHRRDGLVALSVLSLLHACACGGVGPHSLSRNGARGCCVCTVAGSVHGEVGMWQGRVRVEQGISKVSGRGSSCRLVCGFQSIYGTLCPAVEPAVSLAPPRWFPGPRGADGLCAHATVG